MRRRDFIKGITGSAAAWPLAARAQRPAMPVIGFLAEGTPDSEPGLLLAFQQGLREVGYVEGQNVQIDYRWSGDQRDLLLAVTAELVRREVAVIYSARGSAVAQAAKAATPTIPIVFTNGGDPIKLGLVANLNRPGGNVTGTTFFSNVLTAKRLTLLHDLVPSAVNVAVLINPSNANADTDRGELQTAARAAGLRLKLLPASNDQEIDAAFAAMAQDRPAALFVAADAYLFSRSDQIIAQVARLGIPAIYPRREQVVAGGLVSYATDALDSSRVAGTYVGRILKGEKPGNLPVQQPTRFKLVINLKTAKALGIEIPATPLSLADEVIE
jgi:putative tryptophan/tyrosine transport system substrate-binding protein